MKTTLFGILTLCFLAGCSSPEVPVENTTQTQSEVLQESQNETVNETSTEIPELVSQEVLSEDILQAEKIVSEIANSELSSTERDSLIFMREEEKLAQDVYLELYDVWGQQIFTNIASSEQSHTDAVKTLLERYDIPDPVTGNTRGVFTSPVIQGLYDNLVTEGKKSLLDALIVGATIEDLDIKDLQDASKEIDNEDILLVYANLERGSRNHMRSFIKNITRLGGTYTPQYISQADYDAIIASDTEKGGNNGNTGNGGGMGNGKNR